MRWTKESFTVRSFTVTSLMVAMWALVMPGLAGGAEETLVMVKQPAAGKVLFGEVEFSADLFEVDGDPVVMVDFFIDDRFVDRLKSAPWIVRHDVGDRPVPHRFEIVATTKSGQTASAVLMSRGLDVGLEVESALQQLYITVERNGERVLGLDREVFTVYDNNKRQKTVTFEGGDVPIAALILVDASDSMRGPRLKAALAGASAFIDGMQPLDQAQLVLFSDRVLHQTPFTNFPEVLKAGLSGVKATGGTSLDDHLFLAMERLQTHQGRRVIILLSDGIDVSSIMRMEDVEKSARRSQALLYWIRPGRLGPGEGFNSAWRGSKEHRAELEMLDAMVRRSGGKVVGVRSVREALPAFEKTLRELREQYVIGYYPTQDLGDGSWHEVEVRANDRSLKVRAREGYLDE